MCATTTIKGKEDYNKSHCWQYEIRRRNLEEDLKEANLTDPEMSSLRARDFKFSRNWTGGGISKKQMIKRIALKSYF